MGRGAGMGLGRGIMEGRMDTTKQNQGEGVDEDALDFGKGRARTPCLPSQQQEAEIWSWWHLLQDVTKPGDIMMLLHK